MFRHKTELIVDDNGIEVLVGFDVEESDSQTEFCHGEHEVGCLVDVRLTSVELIIAGKGIDVLPLMTKDQKHSITNQLDTN